MTLTRFPFPLTSDRFQYRTNVEPARGFVETETGGWGGTVFDIDADYATALAERERILLADPSRCVRPPHMRAAAWDTLLTVLGELAAEFPRHMRLDRDASTYRWHNALLGVTQEFELGDEASLPCDPLRFAASQVQDDLVLLDQREDTLWVDAGLVTFAAGWSLGFDAGMRFGEIHGPVPRLREEGVVERSERFLLRLRAGLDFRRTNWSMTVGRRLDTSIESRPDWKPDWYGIAIDELLPWRLHLRVEVQHLIRLSTSGAILFTIRTYLASLAEIAEVPAWRRRLAAVLADLPPDVAEYKGLTECLPAAVRWLRSGASAS
ncbi:hypothetical protein BAY61_15250 [Prauserella marina]|uniref:Uncharacterized protein n=1 Tax=Prauserella marina TaxID=530584 RepID=A0A222VQF2_9PSEU|nr:DUF3445 domain-containing protein [Prauserella marina]ASR36137.1 hypothetical protein BAY61_15250 [Prauserella marina]PWV76877.1 uncharacterized protein DUF3445 [Prauserella marina]SDC99540.1 Protein of unknown function [Prauserella marina]